MKQLTIVPIGLNIQIREIKNNLCHLFDCEKKVSSHIMILMLVLIS